MNNGQGERNRRTARIKVGPASGNVFANLDLPDAPAALAKAELAARIREIFDERGLTQMAAAGLLGISQPKVSALSHGALGGFSSDRLIRFLNALGLDVDIVIRPRPVDPFSHARTSTCERHAMRGRPCSRYEAESKGVAEFPAAGS